MTDPQAPDDVVAELGLVRRAVDVLSGLFQDILERTEDAEKSITRSETAIKWVRRIAVFDLVLTVGLVGGGLFVKSTQDDIQTLSECQAAWTRYFVAGLAERTDAAGTEREANQIRWALMIDALRNPIPNPTPEQRAQLTKRWLGDLTRANQLLAEADAKRAANPIPPLPDCE